MGNSVNSSGTRESVETGQPYLMYPSDLYKDEYKYRTMTIRVLRSKTIAENAKSMLKKINSAYNSISETVDNMYNGTSTSVSDISSSLEENYNKDVKSLTIFTFILPMPNDLQDQQSHEWSTDSGIIGSLGKELENKSLLDVMNKIPGVKGNTGLIGDLASKVTVGRSIASAADVGNFRKPLIDPGYFQNYSGSAPRTFRFKFDFIPRNATEAESVIAIIMKLKEFSSPETSISGVSILAPSYFDIEFSNRYVSDMSNLRGVVLRDMAVSYGADGGGQQFQDGTPKHISLDLTFAERKMMVAGNYRRTEYKSTTKAAK